MNVLKQNPLFIIFLKKRSLFSFRFKTNSNFALIITRKIMGKAEMEDTIIEVLKTIYDPEIPVDVYELGLIYEIIVNDDWSVDVDMTLTSPNCPVAESLPKEVEDKIGEIEGVKSSKVKVVFEPPWDQNMMSEEAKLELGFL